MPTVSSHAIFLVSAWVLVALSASLFFTDMAVSMAKFWSTDFLPSFFLSSSRARLTTGIAPYPVLLHQRYAKQLTFTWLPYLVIALLAIWMRNRCVGGASKNTGYFDPTVQENRPESVVKAIKIQAQYFFKHQLPPRRFWAASLDGGLSVLDLCVVLLWIIFNAIWLCLGYQRKWAVYMEHFNGTGEWTHGSKYCDILATLAYASAWAALYNLVFLFMPIPRNSFLQYLFDTDFTTLIRYHRWWGHGTLLLSLCHGLLFYIMWLSSSRFESECFKWQWSGNVNNLAGTLAFFPFGLAMWITTLPSIRRRFFNVFLSTHIVGFLGFICFLQVHFIGSVWYLPGLVLYFLDVTYRMSQWGVTSGVKCSFVSADRSFVTLNLKFAKAANVKPSQLVFLNVPSVSRFSWHPLSIAGVKATADGLGQDVTIHLKAYGSWTKGVIEHLAEHGTIPVRADGPYGLHHGPKWTAYDSIIMVAGGIGVTPLLGMLREMHYYQSQRAVMSLRAETGEFKGGNSSKKAVLPKLPRSVHLIWAVRKRDELQLLDAELVEAAGLPKSWLKLHLFHTNQAEYYSSAHRRQSSDLLAALDASAVRQPSLRPVDRLLQPYGFGDFTWACAHILSFVGAFFACMLAQAYFVEGQLTGPKGKPVWAVGMLLFLSLIVGAMGLPALMIFPLHLLRYRRHVEACQQALQCAPQALSAQLGPSPNGDTLGKEQIDNVMSDEKDACGPLDIEAGKGATVTNGRPDLPHMIATIASDVPANERVAVNGAGPANLVTDIRLAMYAAQKLATEQGIQHFPELIFLNHSFTL